MIKNIGIAGSGTMATSMALIFAEKGYNVNVIYHREETAIKSKKSIQDSLNQTYLDNEDVKKAILEKIKYSSSFKMFAPCDLIVESIKENLDVKREYWKRVCEVAKEDAILATNTSGLSITDISKVVSNPQRFVGMHWFNPPHLIPLIEVIKGEDTSDDTAKAVYDVALKIGKKPINVSKDAKGFIANRIQLAVLREALHIVEDGIGTYKDVDDAMKYGLGFRYSCLGPFEVTDLGGLDVFHSVGEYLYEDLADDKKPQKSFDELIDSGKLGVKTQEGFYDYHEGRDQKAIRDRDKKFILMKKFQEEAEKATK
jgi:3-hydroxybutyryl-CoA dehydrogenase